MNKQNIKSILTNARLRLAAVTCLILAALGLPTAELVRGGGSPPQPINVTVFIPASVCGFPVQATTTGRLGVISLPGGGFLVTYPATTAVFTNLSDPTKSVTINGFTGPAIITTDQNGNNIIIKVNDKVVVDYIDDKNTYDKGYLALQQHNVGSVVEYKNLMLKILPATPK